MEDEKEKKYTIFKWVFLILSLIFLTLYISQATGYYEFQQQKRVKLTEEKIKQFEKDIASGEKIDINNYLEDMKVDYNNSVSKAGLKISEKIEAIFNGGMKFFFNFLEAMFGE
jgi:hypothetical protein